MRPSPSRTLQEYLDRNQLTPREFAQLSGMPLTEVIGLLSGRLPFSMLHAYHLSAIFNTELSVWLPVRTQTEELSEITV